MSAVAACNDAAPVSDLLVCSPCHHSPVNEASCVSLSSLQSGTYLHAFARQKGVAAEPPDADDTLSPSRRAPPAMCSTMLSTDALSFCLQETTLNQAEATIYCTSQARSGQASRGASLPAACSNVQAAAAANAVAAQSNASPHSALPLQTCNLRLHHLCNSTTLSHQQPYPSICSHSGQHQSPPITMEQLCWNPFRLYRV